MLSSYLRLGLPSGLFSSGFTTKGLYKFLIPYMRDTCRTNFIRLDLIILIFGEEKKLLNSSSCNFLRPPATSSLLGPDILLSTCS